MTRMSPYYCVCFVLLLGTSLCFGQAPTTNKPAVDLKSLRQAYDKAIAKIESDHAAAMQNQPTAYLKELQKLQQNLQKAGNLDGWTAVNQEIERFKTEQTIPDETDASILDGIKNLRAAYKNTLTKCDLEKSKRIIATTKQYVEQLNTLQTNLTKAGKVDEALEVNSEIKTVKSDSKVTSSEFAVAAYEQQNKKETPPPVKPPEQPKKDESDKQAATPTPPADSTNKSTASGDVKTYEGQPFPNTSGQSFKNETMVLTDRVTGGQKISGAVSMSTQNDMQKSTSTYYSSTERTKQGAMSYSIRISLKSANRTYTLEDPKLVIEYFSKPAANSGRADAKKFDTKTYSIPKIDGTRVVNVEFPVVSLQSSSYKYVSGYWGTESYASGNEFYGFVISVFDSKGTLIFQAASNNTLKKLGTAKLP
jgi:hypothetical protein